MPFAVMSSRGAVKVFAVMTRRGEAMRGEAMSGENFRGNDVLRAFPFGMRVISESGRRTLSHTGRGWGTPLEPGQQARQF